MKNSQLSDGEFLAAFESGTLADFHHADHIRVAWIYLHRLPFPDASRRMAESLRHFAATKGARQKYHETITQAWMLLVRGALDRDGPDAASDFDAFAAAHPELLEVHALERFYSSQLLASPAARCEFVPPDLSPLPGFRHEVSDLYGICNCLPASAFDRDMSKIPSLLLNSFTFEAVKAYIFARYIAFIGGRADGGQHDG